MPWGWRDLIKALLAAAVIFVLCLILVNVLRAPISALEHALARGGLSPHVFVLVLSSVIAYGAAALAVGLFIVRPYRVSWATLGYRAVPLARFGILLAAYPLTVTTAGAVLVLESRVLLHGHLVNPQVQQIAGGVTRTTPNIVGLVLIVAVLAPTVEETVFRGVLYQWLRKSLPVWGAALVSAAVFAAAHAIPIIFPWLFVTGIALALTFEYGRTIYCSILLHGLINGVNIAVLISSLHR